MQRELTRANFLRASGLGLAGVSFALTLAPARALGLEGSQSPARTSTNATYYNNASFNAADPYVLHDERSGYYYVQGWRRSVPIA